MGNDMVMRFKIEVSGPRACGKTRTVNWLLSELKHEYGNYTVDKMIDDSISEVWEISVKC